MIRLLLALMTLASPAIADEGVALPAGFDGVYATEGLVCDSLGRVEIRDGAMVGAEFAMTVTDLIEVPGDPNKVEVSLSIAGGGGEWTDSAVLTLSGDGQSLRFDYPDSSTVMWSRCG